ncbi:MAG TPA: glycosyltransferase family 9 protein [Pyrinomonadaceae bacterium]|nr:glycosyltransferase family 9 protein [Pyrinomonadaceae bacterium]
MTSPEIDWGSVKRVLVVRLRSIGDTVLSTPALVALKRFIPNAEIDILLEEWVAPLLDGFDSVDRVIVTGDDLRSRLRAAREIRRRKYDIVFNLHGGPTSGLFVRTSGARHRVGYENYRWPSIYNHRLSSPSDFWNSEKNHSAEQQLALLGFVGVPVEDRPPTRLVVTDDAAASLARKFVDAGANLDDTAPFALLHPAAAFETKQWDAANFARVSDGLADRGLRTIAVASRSEGPVLDAVRKSATVGIVTFDNLTLPEITALASKAKLFVGNDSGIAHIAAAVNTPSVVIFGSSNRSHWRPWTKAPNKVVYTEFVCQPCPGHACSEFGEPRCILSVKVEDVNAAIESVLREARVAS